MAEANTDEFLEKDFSVGEYLGKILGNTAGECARIRDSHLRVLSQHSEALTEELLENKEEIEAALRTLQELSRECARIAKELPDLFLPVLEYEKKPGVVAEHKKFKHEMKQMKGGKALITSARGLKYQEHVELSIDKTAATGKVLVTNDLVVIGVKKEGKYEVYNALMLKELSSSLENRALVLSLPPVYVEILSGEHSSLHKLHTEIEKAQRKKQETAKLFEPTEEENLQEREEYSRYLLKIGRLSQVGDLSVDELVAEVEQSYQATKEWKHAKKALKHLKKSHPFPAVELFCRLVEDDLISKTGEIVQRRDRLERILEALSKVLNKHLKTVQGLFEDDSALSGVVSLHLERVHVKTAEAFIKHFTTTAAEPADVEDALKQLRALFRYPGYTFEYTVDTAQSIKKELLKKKYTFNKNVIINVFENIGQPEGGGEGGSGKGGDGGEMVG